jgi:hypothetical protein
VHAYLYNYAYRNNVPSAAFVHRLLRQLHLQPHLIGEERIKPEEKEAEFFYLQLKLVQPYS